MYTVSQKTLIGGALAIAALSVLLTYYGARPVSNLRVTDEQSTCQLAIAKWEKENPEAAKMKEEYTGNVAPVNFNSERFPRVKNYKTAIAKAVEGGANFNGKYAIAEWGCGSQCQEHAMVDVSTGRVVSVGFPSTAGIDYDSRYPVIITNPAQNLPNPEQMRLATMDSLTFLLNVPREYYVLDDTGTTTKFLKLCTENPFEGIGL